MDTRVCENPIFVVGAPRSGTSMMQWALRQHPHLWGGQESDFLIPLYRSLTEVHAFGCQRGRWHWLSGQNVAFKEFAHFIGLGLNAMYTDRSKGKRWVEQTPQYTLHLSEIIQFFPGARFLYMLRDGRQVVQSLRNFVNPMTHEEACRTWAHFTTAALDFRASSEGECLLTVSYESVVSDARTELQRVFDFLGEPFEEACVDFITKKAPINSSFAGEGSEGKLAPRWHTWTDEERRQFVDMAGALLVTTGYERDSDWVHQAPLDDSG